jgi:hypothetical protein
MKNSSNARRQINNELKTRSHNQRVKKTLEHHAPDEVQDELVVDFYCECSDDTCTERIPMTFQEYDELHNSPAKFVLAPGHQSPMVEKVVKADGERTVVKKYAL